MRRAPDIMEQQQRQPACSSWRDGWCVAHVAKALRRPAEKIDPQITFVRLGVDSAMAVYLVAELEEWLGRELAPEVAFEYPTIAELARHLAGEPD